MKISEVLGKYKTDKVNEHSYGDFYDEVFSRFNREDKLNILEIGIQKGGSLLAWKEYFPNSNVIGVDIVDEVLPEYRSKDINYVFMDIKEWVGDSSMIFNIIIDDGSHMRHDVMYTVNKFYDRLNGIMVIEDVQSTNWVNYIDVPHTLIDLRSKKGRYDDLLILIKNEVTR